jgi:hypothetical protein
MTMSGEKTPGWTPRTAYVVALLTIVYAFNSVDRNLFGLMIPLIEKDMELSDTTIGLLSGFAFAIFYASAALPIASFQPPEHHRRGAGLLELDDRSARSGAECLAAGDSALSARCRGGKQRGPVELDHR